jgi:hypothetical protein
MPASITLLDLRGQVAQYNVSHVNDVELARPPTAPQALNLPKPTSSSSFEARDGAGGVVPESTREDNNKITAIGVPGGSTLSGHLFSSDVAPPPVTAPPSEDSHDTNGGGIAKPPFVVKGAMIVNRSSTFSGHLFSSDVAPPPVTAPPSEDSPDTNGGGIAKPAALPVTMIDSFNSRFFAMPATK